ncbi:MAG TPA: SgcJ/EcaC family oxidoreductase [Myxococcales bacterium]|nr:SgcJ/EcaC family oxidoreductase [Myxococcales bacterium]
MPRILIALALAGCATADVVQRQIDAYNAHDLNAFAATYSDDVLITSAKGEVLVLGKEGLRERYGKAFAQHPNVRCTVAERKADGAAVLVHEIITGRTDKSGPWDAGWLRYEVKDGLIHSVQLP